MFGFVTSEGKNKEDNAEEGMDESNPLLKVKPKTFTEVRWLENFFFLTWVHNKATSQRVTFAGMRNKATMKNKETINGDDSKQPDSDYSWVDKLGFWPRKIWYGHNFYA